MFLNKIAILAVITNFYEQKINWTPHLGMEPAIKSWHSVRFYSRLAARK